MISKRLFRGPWLWIVIIAAIGLAKFCEIIVPFARIEVEGHWLYHLGLLFMLAGIAIRIVAIWTLRRFFTVHVTIHENHELIRSGLYRLVRHPSYTGALLAFLGLALTMGNGLSILVLVIPITMAFLRRIRVEEAALREKFGADYDAYRRETNALIPGVY